MKTIVIGSKVSWKEQVHSKKGASTMKYLSGIVVRDLYDINKTHWVIVKLKGKKKVRKRAKFLYLNGLVDNSHLSDKHIENENIRKAIKSGRGIDNHKLF